METLLSLAQFSPSHQIKKIAISEYDKTKNIIKEEIKETKKSAKRETLKIKKQIAAPISFFYQNIDYGITGGISLLFIFGIVNFALTVSWLAKKNVSGYLWSNVGVMAIYAIYWPIYVYLHGKDTNLIIIIVTILLMIPIIVLPILEILKKNKKTVAKKVILILYLIFYTLPVLIIGILFIIGLITNALFALILIISFVMFGKIVVNPAPVLEESSLDSSFDSSLQFLQDSEEDSEEHSEEETKLKKIFGEKTPNILQKNPFLT